MVAGNKKMDKQSIKKQRGITIHSFLFSILISVMVFLGGAMIWVILISPNFGKQLAIPIQSFSCFNNIPLTQKPPKIDQCYKVEDVLALNKALNMSDTLGMLGLLLAVFALLTPLFSYITLLKEKHALESIIQNEIVKSKLEIRELLEQAKCELNGTLISSLYYFPNFLVSLESFKISYIADKTPDRETTSSPLLLLTFMRHNAEANDIAARLLKLLDNNSDAISVFHHIKNYIKPEDVGQNKRHINSLLLLLRQFYNANCFGSNSRKEMLKQFLDDTLHRSFTEFLNDTNISGN